MIKTTDKQRETQSFLTVDRQSISVSQAIKYLQSASKLQPFIIEILRQHIIEQEIRLRKDLEINSAVVEQAIIDFRLQKQLNDPQVFAQWLASNGTDYKSFFEQIAFGFKLEKLKAQVTNTRLAEYFIDRKLFLDRVVISRIIVNNQELADELRSQINEGSSFEELAKEYSLAEDRIVNGMMGPLSRGSLPDALRSTVDLASPGKLIGPLEIDGLWCLFRLEEVLPASLEDQQLKQLLENELFDQWVSEKIKKMSIKLEVI